MTRGIMAMYDDELTKQAQRFTSDDMAIRYHTPLQLTNTSIETGKLRSYSYPPSTPMMGAWLTINQHVQQNNGVKKKRGHNQDVININDDKQIFDKHRHEAAVALETSEKRRCEVVSLRNDGEHELLTNTYTPSLDRLSLLSPPPPLIPIRYSTSTIATRFHNYQPSDFTSRPHKRTYQHYPPVGMVLYDHQLHGQSQRMDYHHTQNMVGEATMVIQNHPLYRQTSEPYHHYDVVPNMTMVANNNHTATGKLEDGKCSSMPNDTIITNATRPTVLVMQHKVPANEAPKDCDVDSASTSTDSDASPQSPGSVVDGSVSWDCGKTSSVTLTVDKPHKCHSCDRAFRKHSALVIHYRVHSGEKPYTCTHCSKQFSISGNLRRHQLIHTGERPYICNICSRAFNNPSHLTRHQRKLHSKK